MTSPFQQSSPSPTSRRRSSVGIGKEKEKMKIHHEEKTKNPQQTWTEKEDSRPPWLTLIDRELGSIPDPTLILRKEIGNLDFDVSTVALDIRGDLGEEITSYLVIEEKVSLISKDFHELPWSFVCESSILEKNSLPHYTADFYKKVFVHFRTKDALLRISLFQIRKDESRIKLGYTVMPLSEVISHCSYNRRRNRKGILSRQLVSNGIKVGDIQISTHLHNVSFSDSFTPENLSLAGEIEVAGKDTYKDPLSLQRSTDFLYFQQPSWMRGQGYYILNYPEFYRRYQHDLEYLEVHCKMDILVESVISFKAKQGKTIPLKSKDKDLELISEMPFKEVCNITLSKINKNTEPNKKYIDMISSQEFSHLTLFKSSNMSNGETRTFTYQSTVKELTTNSEKNRYIFILWKDTNGYISPHAYAILSPQDLCYVNKPYNKRENFTLRSFDPDRARPSSNHLTYLNLSLDKLLVKEEASSSKTSIRSFIVKEFYRSYLVTELRQNAQLLKESIRFEADKRQRESVFLSFLQNNSNLMPLIIFDRGRRNGVPPGVINTGVYYLHNGGTTNKSNYYYHFLKGFSSAFLNYSKNQHIPIYFFGAVKRKHKELQNDTKVNHRDEMILDADDDGGDSYDEEDADDLSKSEDFSNTSPSFRYPSSPSQIFELESSTGGSNSISYNGGVKPLTLGGSSFLGSVEEVITAYDQNLKNYYPKNIDPPLTPVLRSVLRKHPVSKNITKGHSIILFVTASDLKDDEDEIEMGNLLQKYKGKAVTIIFIRLSGPHLPRFYRLRQENLGLYDNYSNNQKTKQFHFVDIRTFERLMRAIQIENEIEAKQKRDMNSGEKIGESPTEESNIKEKDYLDIEAMQVTQNFTFASWSQGVGSILSPRNKERSSSFEVDKSRSRSSSHSPSLSPRKTLTQRFSLFTGRNSLAPDLVNMYEEEDEVLHKTVSAEERGKKQEFLLQMIEEINLSKVQNLLLDRWQLMTPVKYFSMIGETYLGSIPPDKPLKLNELLFLRDIVFSDLMEDYLDETFENIVSDVVSMTSQHQRNSQTLTDDDDKQKSCIHAFGTFFNFLLGNGSKEGITES